MRYFLRLLQLLSTCVAFSLVASMGTWMGAVSNWSMFIWCFCSTMTIFILIVELCGLQSHFPFSWFNFLIIYTCYAALFCISASIIYLTSYIWFFPPGRSQDHAIAATAFSCIASLAYAMEVAWAWTWIWLGLITGYMATVPGLFKGLEIFMACVIFAFISSPLLYQHQPALVWCVAVYAICFLLDIVALLQGLVDCDNRLPFFSILLLVMNLLSVLLYASALVLWPLYQFSEKLGGQPQRSSDDSCSDHHTSFVCIWDLRLTVTILTAINLLLYVADTAYLAREALVGTQAQPRGSQ